MAFFEIIFSLQLNDADKLALKNDLSKIMQEQEVECRTFDNLILNRVFPKFGEGISDNDFIYLNCIQKGDKGCSGDTFFDVGINPEVLTFQEIGSADEANTIMCQQKKIIKYLNHRVKDSANQIDSSHSILTIGLLRKAMQDIKINQVPAELPAESPIDEIFIGKVATSMNTDNTALAKQHDMGTCQTQDEKQDQPITLMSVLQPFGVVFGLVILAFLCLLLSPIILLIIVPIILVVLTVRYCRD